MQIAPQRWVILRVEQFQSARLDDPAIPPRLLQLEGEAELQQRMESWLKGRETLSPPGNPGAGSGPEMPPTTPDRP